MRLFDRTPARAAMVRCGMSWGLNNIYSVRDDDWGGNFGNSSARSWFHSMIWAHIKNNKPFTRLSGHSSVCSKWVLP